MKKLLFLVFVMSTIIVNAQTPINLSFSDLGVPVRSYDIRIDSAVTSAIVPGNPGTNLTWNFIALHANLDTLPLHLINSSSGVMHTSFPGANVAYQVDTNLNYNYYNSTTAGLIHRGIVTDYLGTHDSIKVVFSSPDTILRLPGNYMDSYTSIVMGDSKSRCHYTFDTSYNGFPITVPIDTLRIKHKQFHLAQVDAWGTMTTPMDNFPVLRQKNTTQTRDTIWGYANVPPPAQSYSGWYRLMVLTDTSVSYNWWMKGLGIPAVQMDMYKLTNVVLKVRWVRDVFASVNENTDVYNNGVYPNPANDKINITNTAVFNEAIIYDVLGNEVKRQNILGLNEISVSTANLPNGMYFYNLNGTQGKTSGKFIVKH
ncbi:MAG: T9SS type A sorting domain-containing protein [Bacteroidota bacterium]